MEERDDTCVKKRDELCSACRVMLSKDSSHVGQGSICKNSRIRRRKAALDLIKEK